LLKEKLGIDHVVAVVGPSMAHAGAAMGRQPSDYMDGAGGDVPLAKDAGRSVRCGSLAQRRS